ncbi:hypothetical protein [Nocardioides sp. Soil805]|uniref:hypothetical protein n=1 Tax=Nocardioides sp. Soil805 TaxID=1736416 RepID=UPI0007037099|nr:hypothetical protein [Nocardioides sp. Soil805]KRF37592.1 hypothetical protein ASG94_09910 [Nocardioides sp. Soil805]
MTAPDDPSLSPAEEAAVRARLAEARHTDPVPEHVVARLDAVLSDLLADRVAEHRAPEPEPLAPVVPLAARRRRVLTGGLVAAAAVVVLGVAIPQVLDSTTLSGGDDAASTADRSAGGGSAAEVGPSEDRDSAGQGTESSPDQLSPGPQAAEGQRSGSAFTAPLALSSSEPLRPAVRALARQGAAGMYTPSPRCRLDVGDGERVDATWEGLPALVVLRPVEDGRRGVDVYVCGSDEPVAATSLRAR